MRRWLWGGALVAGLVAGCTIVTPATKLGAGNYGGSGGTTPFGGSGQASAATSGTGGVVPDAGALSSGPITSYQYLCGGSQASCVPGQTTDLCAPGGDPGLGGGTPSGSVYSCQLVPGDGGVVVAQCGNSGAGGVGDPCASSTDCQAELGCVGVDGGVDGGVDAGVCRAYCCDGLETCPNPVNAGTYCLPARLAGTEASLIPVCVPTTPCELLVQGSCPAGMSCQVVRESGTTSCVQPGDGGAGQPCPCADGYTCSWSEGTCVELCLTEVDGGCGADSYCQGGLAALPAAIGYCVSLDGATE